MRVLWVGHNLAYPPVRGVLQRNFNLLREAAKSCEVHVLAFDQPRTRPPGVGVEDCVAALRKFCARVEPQRLPAGAFGSRPWLALRGLATGRAYDLGWLSSPLMAGRLRETLERTKFDVVHFDTLGLAPYARLVRGAGTVLNHHNLESSMMEQRAAAEPRRLARRFWRGEAARLLRAERDWCPRFDVNLVVSPEDAEALAARVPGVTTRVVANGVDTDYFTPRPDPGGATLIFCGGLDWYPNADAMAYFFERIWPLLVLARPDVRMLVVGRNPPSWLLRLGESDRRVRVTGFVEDVRPYFREATVYVCPIRKGGGTRLKVLDALAMGMPMVATTFACSGLGVKDGAHAMLADMPEIFVDRIRSLLVQPEMRARLSAEARSIACSEYSWARVGRILGDAYRYVASAGVTNARPESAGTANER